MLYFVWHNKKEGGIIEIYSWHAMSFWKQLLIKVEKIYNNVGGYKWKRKWNCLQA